MISKREKKAIETKANLINAVGTALKKHGFAKLGVYTVATESKLDKTGIYRYFKDFDDLLKAYIEQQEYWLKSIKEIDTKQFPDMKDLAKSFLNEQLDALMSSEEFRQLILWELADRDGIASPITVKRELYSSDILKQSRTILEKSGINFNYILALILGGLYYLTIHKDKFPFCEVDLNQKTHKTELINTINWLIDSLFEIEKTNNAMESVAIKAHAEGIDINTISKITEIEIDRLKEILT